MAVVIVGLLQRFNLILLTTAASLLELKATNGVSRAPWFPALRLGVNIVLLTLRMR